MYFLNSKYKIYKETFLGVTHTILYNTFFYYLGVTGAWLHIDENGDVEGNYTVLSLQPAPSNLSLKGFRGKRNLSHVMLPMATFQYDELSHEPVRNFDSI